MRRDRWVLVSPWVRTDRQTAMCGGTGGLAAGSPSRSTWVQCRARASSVRIPVEQAGHDVGVHELGGAAGVFEAGPQFHHGQGGGGGDDGDGLVEGEGFGGAAWLACGGVGQGGDVAGDGGRWLRRKARGS